MLDMGTMALAVRVEHENRIKQAARQRQFAEAEKAQRGKRAKGFFSRERGAR